MIRMFSTGDHNFSHHVSLCASIHDETQCPRTVSLNALHDDSRCCSTTQRYDIGSTGQSNARHTASPPTTAPRIVNLDVLHRLSMSQNEVGSAQRMRLRYIRLHQPVEQSNGFPLKVGRVFFCIRYIVGLLLVVFLINILTTGV